MVWLRCDLSPENKQLKVFYQEITFTYTHIKIIYNEINWKNLKYFYKLVGNIAIRPLI